MKENRYTFREANEADLGGLADLFSRHDYGPKKPEWLRWKYIDNPDGRARLYVAEDANGKIVGLTARLPRRFRSPSTGIFTVMQNVDVFVAAEVRNKGVYTKLSEFAGSKRDYLMIGFPNKLSRRISDLDGVIPLEDWWFPVKPGPLISKKAFGPFAPAADALSRVYASFWLRGRTDKLRMQPVERFVNGFDIDSNFIRGVRSAEFLNWRYVDNPMCRYSIHEFLDEKEIIGYCVYAMAGSTAEIFDFIVNRHRRACLRLFVDHCRSRGITDLSFRGAGLRLGKFGFVRHASSEDCITSDVRDGPRIPQGRWLITLSDRDV